MSDPGKVLDNLSSTSFFSSPETARKMKKDFTENDRTLSPSNGLGKPTANTATIQDLATLKSSLSIDATVDLIGEAGYATSAARWSDLNTPKPGAVVNVASESDIEATVSILSLLSRDAMAKQCVLPDPMGYKTWRSVRRAIRWSCMGQLVQNKLRRHCH